MDIDGWIGRNIPEVVLDDAAAWLARLDSGNCNDADRMEFARWLGEDPTHQWAFEELSEIWARLHTLADVRPLMDDPKIVRLADRSADSGRRVLPQAPGKAPNDWTALAASLLVALGVAAHYAASTPPESFRAHAGDVQLIELDDGSRVELNARSHVDVRLDDGDRRITLIEGDAVFHVAADRRPFVVKTRGGTVEALGTAFAVSTGGARFEVAVLEGRVAVRPDRRRPLLTELDDLAAVSLDSGVLMLAAGERLEIYDGVRRLHAVPPAELQQAFTWRHGYLEFHEQPLGAVVAEMRRYLDLNIHVADPMLAELRISGRFLTGDGPAFLRHMQEHPDIVVDRADSRWIILRPRQLASRG